MNNIVSFVQSFDKDWNWQKTGTVNSQSEVVFFLGCRKGEKKVSIVLEDVKNNAEHEVNSISEGERLAKEIVNNPKKKYIWI